MARILLAEDDTSMRHYLANELQDAGHDVIAANDGLDALPHVANDVFDLLVTDINMPGMDGIELARRAGLEMPDLKVIFVTGFAASALNNEIASRPGTEVLSKPFHLRDLVSEIDRLLALP